MMSEPAAGQRPTSSSWRRWALRAGVVLGFAATAWVLGSVSASASPPDSTLPALDSLSGLDTAAPALAEGLLESTGDLADSAVTLAASPRADDDGNASTTERSATEHSADDDAAEPSNQTATSPVAAGSADPVTGATQPLGGIVSMANEVVATTVAETSRAASAVAAGTEPVLDQARRLAPSADLLNEAVRPLAASIADAIGAVRAAVAPLGEAVVPTLVASVPHSGTAHVVEPVGAQHAASGDDAALGPMPSATAVPARGANGVIHEATAADAASAPARSGTAVDEALAEGRPAAPTPERPAQQPPPAAVAPAANSAAGSTTNSGHDYAGRMDAAITPRHHASITVGAGTQPAPIRRAGEPGFSPG
jgi:hypothetical protein